MPEDCTITLDHRPIRFTSDGKMAVIDAIGSVGERSDAERIWQHLRKAYPEIRTLCSLHHFGTRRATEVVDSDGWEQIHVKLFEFLYEP